MANRIRKYLEDENTSNELVEALFDTLEENDATPEDAQFALLQCLLGISATGPPSDPKAVTETVEEFRRVTSMFADFALKGPDAH